LLSSLQEQEYVMKIEQMDAWLKQACSSPC